MTKYLKIACILGILGLGGNVIADDMQKEIEALKKENELLELKKKNEQLKAGKEVKESSAESAVDKSGFLGFCKGEHKNTGCFIGVELGYAPSVTNEMSIDAGINYRTFNQSTYSLPINLALGWQWYYAQNAGFQFKGHIGYAGYGSSKKTYEDPTNPSNTTTLDLNSSAVHFGLEASYLYDFIYNETHTFGANVGIGYEFGAFVGQGYEFKDNQGGQSFNLDSYFASSFITSIGIHYFYKSHHQFGLSYRYKSGYTIGEGGSQTINTQNGNFNVKYSTTPNSAIILSYLYRF